MTALSSFMKRIRLRAPGVAQPVAYDAIVNAAQRFCERTRLWREQVEITVDTAEEAITPPAGSAIIGIEAARMNDCYLLPKSLDWLRDHVPDWQDLDTGPAKYVTQFDPYTVRIVPADTGALTLDLYLKPSDDATELPDWMAAKYNRVICDGALGDLLAMPGQVFTSGELAVMHESKFMNELDELSAANVTGEQGALVKSKTYFF